MNVHQESVKTETVQKSDTKDSASKTFEKTVEQNGIKLKLEFDSSQYKKVNAKDWSLTITPSKSSDYDSGVTIQSNVIPKSATFEKKHKKEKEKLDSTVKKSLTVEDIKKEEKVITKVKTVDKKKVVFQWWWFVLLAAAILGFIYRKPIKAFIIKIISPFKFISMKLLIIILSTFFLASCWNNDSRPPRELASGVYQEEVIQVPDSVMQWSVEKKQYVKVWGFTTKVVPIKEFEVVPNGEQVKKFAKEGGQVGFNWIGLLILLGVTAAAIFGAGYYESGKAKAYVRVAAILVAIAVGFFTLKPANIAQNNAKTITEKQLKHYQSIDPELNYFWDSINKAGGIIGK